MFCENCGHQMDDNAVFCENCGTKRVVPVEEVKPEEEKVAAVANVANAVSETVAKSGKNFKVPVIIVAVVVLVAAGIFAATSLLGGGGGSNDVPLLLNINDDFYFISKGMEEPAKIAELGNHERVNQCVAKSDGSGVYFITYDNELYYADFNSVKKDEAYEPEKISGNVAIGTLRLYDDKYVLFYKNGALYAYDGEEDHKLKANVTDFWCLDGNVLVQCDYNSLYVCDLATFEDEKYEGEESYLLHASEGSNEFVYYRYGDYNEETGGDKDLYLGKVGSEPTLIAEGVQMCSVTFDGEVYYSFRAKGEAVSLMDFVEDPYGDESNLEAPEDEAFKIPTPPGGLQGPGVYYIDNEAYDAAWDEYWAAVDRQELREELADMTYDQTNNEVYCFKDGKSKLLADNAVAMRTSGNGAFIMLSGSDVEVSPIIHIDDIDYAYEVREMINDAYGMNTSRTDFDNVYICEDGETLCDVKGLDDYYGIDFAYVRADKNLVMGVYNDEESVVYVGKVDGTIEMEVLIDDGGIAEHGEDCIYYYKDDFDSATLYMYKDGKHTKIDDDVKTDSLVVNEDGSLLYLTDFSYNTYLGELCLYDGKEPVSVADDVRNGMFTLKQGLVYYVTYDNSEYDGGELYSCKKGAEEATFIVDDVTEVWNVR